MGQAIAGETRAHALGRRILVEDDPDVVAFPLRDRLVVHGSLRSGRVTPPPAPASATACPVFSGPTPRAQSSVMHTAPRRRRGAAGRMAAILATVIAPRLLPLLRSATLGRCPA